MFRAVRVADGWVDVDEALIELARPRCQLESFLGPAAGTGGSLPPSGGPLTRVRRVTGLREPRTPLTGSLAPWGWVALDGPELAAEIPDDKYAAESVLRIAFHLRVAAAGGFLMHSSGVVLGEAAIVALGESGAGKSTFASLVCAAPGARLLSDEIIALYPDGTVHGTPFRSDYAGAGAPLRVPLAGLFTLAKGQEERVDPLAGARAVAPVLAQTYAAPLLPLSRAQTLARVAAVVEKVGVSQLTFRKDPAVASFVARWVHEHRVGA